MKADESPPTNRFDSRRLLTRLASIAVFGWLLWTGLSEWNWLAVALGTAALTTLTIAKNSYWRKARRTDAANQLRLPPIFGLFPLVLIAFNLLLAVAAHTIARILSLLF